MALLPPPPVAPVPVQSSAPASLSRFHVHSAHGRLFVRLRRHHHHHNRLHHKHHKHAEISSPRELVFEVTTGRILYQNKVVLDHFQSGRGNGMNNPTVQDQANFGPTPVGLYYLGAPVDKSSQHMGRDAMYLIPAKSNAMYGRSDMLMHSREGRTGTHGCIGAPNQAEQEKLVAFVAANHIRNIKVVSRAGDTNEPRMMVASAEALAISSPVKHSARITPMESAAASDTITSQPIYTSISLPESSIKSTLRDFAPNYTFGSRTFIHTLDMGLRP